jgi:uncharacterized membrane protein YfcA
MMSLALLAAVMAGGALAGGLGALLGLGGGVFLVPFLTLALDVPIRHAIAASLLTVIATSSSVSAARVGRNVINLRLGMLLEVATAAGGLVGGVTAYYLRPGALYALFGAVMLLVAAVTLGRLHVRNILPDGNADPGPYGGRFYDEESGRPVVYRVRRLPLALVGSFLAGNVSSLLGIGGGIVKVPMLNAWCGVPLRVAAATSAFMIGVTAASGAVIYYGSGDVVPPLAAAAVLGVHIGSSIGLRIGTRVTARHMKLLMAAVMIAVAILMFVRSVG